jgi:streptomycin 3"-adenylyltransferase
MPQYNWNDCPVTVKTQLQTLTDDLVNLLAGNLIGVYVHGSLAMGCFNPRHSDLDLLVISQRHLEPVTRRSLAEILLQRSCVPQPVELSVLTHNDIMPWKYPTPFAFHYSEMWRDQIERDLANGNWRHWNDSVRTDPDLAAHITITRHRGIRIYGAPIPDVFPEVPVNDYLASIIEDITGALDAIQEDPIYAVLNTCRVWAFINSGLICSKHEGGMWALSRVPKTLHPVVATALQGYADGYERVHFDPAALAIFATYMRARLAQA